MSLVEKTAAELSDLLKSKKVSAKEIVDSVYERIDDVEKDYNAYISLTKDMAYEQAKKVDVKISKGETLQPLEGIPISVKDNMNVKGTETTCASKILKGYISPYDATIVEAIKKTGMIIVGKTNLDEFAMGSSTENSAFGPSKNPWDISAVPGGSSGGAAVSIAANEAIVAIGSDTGGSIRQPASFCGVVGMKPTYGRVSRYGLVAFASSLDQIGPFTKTVADTALMLNMMCGKDSKDSTSVDKKVPDFTKSLNQDIKGLKIGVIKELMGKGADPEVKKAIEDSIQKFTALGAICEEVSLPSFDYAVATYYIIAPAEASANLSRFDGVKYGHREKADTLVEMYEKTRSKGFGPEVKRRIMIGSYVLSSGYYDAYYLKAQKVRTFIRDDFNKQFEKYDVLVSPTSSTVAFKFGERIKDPLSMYLSDIATISVNLAGLPAISIPCGFSKGLPIGLQIIGKHYDEETIIRCADAFEKKE
jgi:aspartyl-tRNA(Asn)/glutamyl-tRNA(Gln) amidotransferase subunit A